MAGHELLEHRLPALAAGHDRKAVAHGAGLQDRGIGHADHRHLGDLLERGETRVAEAGEDHGIFAAAIVGEGIDRGVAGDGIAHARGDVARAEGAGDGAQIGALCGEASGRLQHQVGDRLRGVGVDQQDLGHSCMISFRRATSSFSPIDSAQMREMWAIGRPLSSFQALN